MYRYLCGLSSNVSTNTPTSILVKIMPSMSTIPMQGNKVSIGTQI